jgi:hypothetical protein
MRVFAQMARVRRDPCLSVINQKKKSATAAGRAQARPAAVIEAPDVKAPDVKRQWKIVV